MDIANLSPIERIARVLAGAAASANAQGDLVSAGDVVDARWRDYLPVADAVLRTLREPSTAMAAVGDAAVWERMILAGLEEGAG